VQTAKEKENLLGNGFDIEIRPIQTHNIEILSLKHKSQILSRPVKAVGPV
jgi:hypothetical protein